jgi:aromatic-amino-acid transaminase
MKTMADIYRDRSLLSQVGRERSGYVDLMWQRADIFVEEAKAVGLKFAPYCGCFSISVPTSDPVGASTVLQQSNIFVVPLAKGLRIAVCSVPVTKMKGLAGKVVEALSKV